MMPHYSLQRSCGTPGPCFQCGKIGHLRASCPKHPRPYPCSGSGNKYVWHADAMCTDRSMVSSEHGVPALVTLVYPIIGSCVIVKHYLLHALQTMRSTKVMAWQVLMIVHKLWVTLKPLTHLQVMECIRIPAKSPWHGLFILKRLLEEIAVS